jgi:hypothetical protein
MFRPITSLARLAGTADPNRRARALVLPLLVAGLIAAGCGTVSAGGTGAAGGPAAGGTATGGGTADGGGSAASPAPVTTVTGGPVTPGMPACVGWPSDAPHETLTLLWTPVAVERCVTAIRDIPGQGRWETATLERADHGLGPLITALRRPQESHRPGTLCPDLAMLPPQIVLFNAAGQKMIPRLPLTGCGLVQIQLTAALAALPWQPMSVRMVAKIPSGPAATHSPGTTMQTLPAQP